MLNTISIESLQCNIPTTPDPLDLTNSVIIKDDYDTPTIVGAAARTLTPESTKRRGGCPAQVPYRNLLKGAAAMLGPGEHVFDSVAFTTAIDSIHRWREKPGDQYVSPEQEKIIRSTLEKVEFKHAMDEEWQTCSISFRERAFVQMECVAVARSLPVDHYRTYLLWQLGFGDWQQLAMIDGKPIPGSMLRVDGIQGAYNIFEAKSGLSKGQARDAWEKKIIPEKGGMNGKSESAQQAILSSTSSHVNKMIGVLLNQIDSIRDRIHNIVLSGGTSRDRMVVEIIREAVASEDNLNLYLIEDIMKEEGLGVKNASFATVAGLNTLAPLCFDIGNNFIKLGYVS